MKNLITFVLFSMIILILSFIPDFSAKREIKYELSTSGFEKHLAAYAVWIVLAARVFPRRLWTVFLSGILFGWCVEVLQWPIAWRTFNVMDVFGNIAGLMVGTVFVIGARRVAPWFNVYY